MYRNDSCRTDDAVTEAAALKTVELFGVGTGLCSTVFINTSGSEKVARLISSEDSVHPLQSCEPLARDLTISSKFNNNVSSGQNIGGGTFFLSDFGTAAYCVVLNELSGVYFIYQADS